MATDKLDKPLLIACLVDRPMPSDASNIAKSFWKLRWENADDTQFYPAAVAPSFRDPPQQPIEALTFPLATDENEPQRTVL